MGFDSYEGLLKRTLLSGAFFVSKAGGQQKAKMVNDY
jgi:hypothetical protein